MSGAFSSASETSWTVITGASAVQVGETGGSLVRDSEQSIGSETTPGNGWNSVTCGGALAEMESKGCVIVQDVTYVNEQQGTRADLDRRVWNYGWSWNDVGV